MSDSSAEWGLVYRFEAMESLMEWLISRLPAEDREALELAHQSLQRLIAAERPMHGGPPRDEDLRTPNALRGLLARGLARSADAPLRTDVPG